jgi:hypothetical protein
MRDRLSGDARCRGKRPLTEQSQPAPIRLQLACVHIDRFGTLKIASRFFPKLWVAINVAVKVRPRPETAANFHLLAFVSRFPFFGFLPAIVTFAAMRFDSST